VNSLFKIRKNSQKFILSYH